MDVYQTLLRAMIENPHDRVSRKAYRDCVTESGVHSEEAELFDAMARKNGPDDEDPAGRVCRLIFKYRFPRDAARDDAAGIDDGKFRMRLWKSSAANGDPRHEVALTFDQDHPFILTFRTGVVVYVQAPSEALRRVLPGLMLRNPVRGCSIMDLHVRQEGSDESRESSVRLYCDARDQINLPRIRPAAR